jgi:hypothetical protein
MAGCAALPLLLSFSLPTVEVAETIDIVDETEVLVKPAVDVPPANWIALVVVLPTFVTCWRFGVVDVAGQLVPFARHTA